MAEPALKDEAALLVLVCQNCGDEMPAKRRTKKWCSDDCKRAGLRVEREPELTLSADALDELIEHGVLPDLQSPDGVLQALIASYELFARFGQAPKLRECLEACKEQLEQEHAEEIVADIWVDPETGENESCHHFQVESVLPASDLVIDCLERIGKKN